MSKLQTNQLTNEFRPSDQIFDHQTCNNKQNKKESFEALRSFGLCGCRKSMPKQKAKLFKHLGARINLCTHNYSTHMYVTMSKITMLTKGKRLWQTASDFTLPAPRQKTLKYYIIESLKLTLYLLTLGFIY